MPNAQILTEELVRKHGEPKRPERARHDSRGKRRRRSRGVICDFPCRGREGNLECLLVFPLGLRCPYLGKAMSRRAAKSSARRRAFADHRPLLLETLEDRTLLAGMPEMVEDAIAGGGISPSLGSAPFYLTNVGGTLYFMANDGANGFELWRTNALQQVEMVEDAVAGEGINPGAANAYPRSLTNVGGTLYFHANDGTNGVELWRINASGQAEMVEDAVASGGINPDAADSNPQTLTNFNGTLYFKADNGPNVGDLWRINSSGQAEMVLVLADSYPNSNPMTVTNGTLYFPATVGTNGRELWRINAAGQAAMIEDALAGGGINPGLGDSIPFPVNPNVTNVNGTIYFRATDGTNGFELWRIDAFGTAEMVEDAVAGGGIRPGSTGSYPANLANANGTLYFSANDGTSNVELWRINASGKAELVEDSVAGGGINPDPNGSGPNLLNYVNGTLYFVANDGTHFEELWRINAAGKAEMIDDNAPGVGIHPDPFNPYFSDFTDISGTLYFGADDDTNGHELWRINSAGMAEMVEDSEGGAGINPGSTGSLPRSLTNISGTLYFAAMTAADGLELWRINASGQAEMVEDGTPDGGIYPGSTSCGRCRTYERQWHTVFPGQRWHEWLRTVASAASARPVIGSFGGAATYTENAPAPTRLADAATVTDSDSPNFATGRLVARLTANAQSTDRLSIVTIGNVSTSGNEVRFAGTKIGTFSGGAGGTALTIKFNAQANANKVQAVLRSLAYQSISENPSAAPRTMAVFVSRRRRRLEYHAHEDHQCRSRERRAAARAASAAAWDTRTPPRRSCWPAPPR